MSSSAIIEAPTTSEAPEYVQGTEVQIVLETDDGKILLDTKTTSFPQAANYYGITSAAGTITMYYTVTSDGVLSTDSVTGETTIIPGTPEIKSFTRRIQFTRE